MSRQLPRLLPARDTTVAPPAWVGLSPAMQAALLDPESWHESLDAYAHATHLAVALVDVAGRLLGPCRNPRPTWSQLYAAGAIGGGCPFALALPVPCTCVSDALVRNELVLTHDRTRLVHFTVPLVLEGQPVGALLAGQVFDQYPEQLLLEHVAQHVGLSPQTVWQAARLELPVKRTTLRVYGRLLATLGQAFLHTRYHTLMDGQRLAALEYRFQERTAALHREIAERQRLEREAHRAEHFALLGRLAAGVSHELRNPLGAVFLHVDLLDEELHHPSVDSQTQMMESLAEIKAQLTRMDDLMQDYLSFVRVGTLERTPADVGTLLQSWVTEWYPLAAVGGVTLRLEDVERLGDVAVHANTLYRALLNLVHNALEAMPQGGILTLRGERTAGAVHLRIQDTGHGIAANRLPKIFEPLFTTKPGGTGLGLYIVREIMLAHDGQVTVESVEGQGTTFTLRLPVTTDDTQ